MKSDNGTPELGHGTVFELSITNLKPAPENDELYRSVDPTDPEVQSLAESIRKTGVMEPLVMTLDGLILSGHRQLMAASLAGLEAVPCCFKISAEDVYELEACLPHDLQSVLRDSIDSILDIEAIKAKFDAGRKTRSSFKGSVADCLGQFLPSRIRTRSR